MSLSPQSSVYSPQSAWGEGGLLTANCGLPTVLSIQSAMVMCVVWTVDCQLLTVYSLQSALSNGNG